MSPGRSGMYRLATRAGGLPRIGDGVGDDDIMTSRRPSAPRGGARQTAPRPARGSAHSRPGGTATRTGRTGRSRGRATTARGTTRTPRGGAARSGSDRRVRRALAFGDGQSRPAISLRALALFVVILVAFVIVAPTLRYAVAQQEELRSLNADVAEARERNAELRRQIELWQNPEYVEAQARDRLGYVMPGETPYVVVDPETVTGGESPAEEQAAERQAERAAATPWYLRTWESVQVAGESAVGDEDPSGLTVPTDEPTP